MYSYVNCVRRSQWREAANAGCSPPHDKPESVVTINRNTHRTAQRVQSVAERARQPAAIHVVVRLQVSNGGLHRCPPLEPTPLLFAQTLELASVNDLFVGVVSVTGAVPVFEFGGHCSFDLTPGQPTCQDCQGIVRVDHRVNSAAEKASGLHTKISQKVSPILTLFERFGAHDLYKQSNVYAGWRGF
jgi:hypothetical protein